MKRRLFSWMEIEIEIHVHVCVCVCVRLSLIEQEMSCTGGKK